VSTALPHILATLPGATLLGWVFTAYFVGATATVAVVGKLADLFGRRAVFLVSVGLFSSGSLLCGLAGSLPQLVAFRGLQGVGAGAIQTCSLIVMSDMFPPRERARNAVPASPDRRSGLGRRRIPDHECGHRLRRPNVHDLLSE